MFPFLGVACFCASTEKRSGDRTGNHYQEPSLGRYRAANSKGMRSWERQLNASDYDASIRLLTRPTY